MKRQDGSHMRSSALSLATVGAHVHFEICIVLVTVLPLLALYWLSRDTDASLLARAVVIVATAVIASIGHVLLSRYPRTVVRIRRYLQDIAGGQVPERIESLHAESDLRAIEDALRQVIEELRARIRLIEAQRSQLCEAERAKVMMESLCTVCHHLGQPATILLSGLELLRRDPLPLPAQDYLQLCVDAADELARLLHHLQHLSVYRTVAYCPDAPVADDIPEMIELQGAVAPVTLSPAA